MRINGENFLLFVLRRLTVKFAKRNVICEKTSKYIVCTAIYASRHKKRMAESNPTHIDSVVNERAHNTIICCILNSTKENIENIL